tara:strand:- start:5827 stop:6312 length:486 start_codon:yes stop_codon:yes gene_type:complete
MGVIKPTLTLTSNSAAATTDPGPISIALSLSATASLTVDSVQSKIVTPANAGAPTLLLQGEDYAGDSADTPGTHGSFLYLKNATTSGTSIIYVGTVLQGTAAPANMTAGGTALDNADDATFRLMTLKLGEFCWMPWDYMQDMYVGASSADQSLEYFLFDRG